MPRRTLKARRAKRSASRKRQGGCRGSWCSRLFGYGINNENEEMNRLNAYQREKVAAAAAQTKMENEKWRALYGPETRLAKERARNQLGLSSAADHGSSARLPYPSSVPRRRRAGPISPWQKETVF